jgi:GDP-4-dehydro-6-deoxy-D-mannose reductase
VVVGSLRRLRAFVTGATGFVGTHLVAHLRAAGDTVLAPGLDEAPLDVVEPDAVRERIADARPDAVYHLAGLAAPGASWDDPERYAQVNTVGTLSVLEGAAAAGVGRVLVVGSAEQYGIVPPDGPPITEDAPLRPVTPYAASKVAAEFYGLQAFLGRGLGVLRVRAFNHTGPGQSDRFVVSALARRVAVAERGDDPTITVGNLDAVRDYTDVRDVVVAYRLLVERGEAGEVYNVASGVGVTVAHVAETLLRRATRPLTLTVDPALVRPVEVPRLVGDATRLRTATGWSPTHPLEDTLADVLDWWREFLPA